MFQDILPVRSSALRQAPLQWPHEGCFQETKKQLANLSVETMQAVAEMSASSAHKSLQKRKSWGLAVPKHAPSYQENAVPLDESTGLHQLSPLFSPPAQM